MHCLYEVGMMTLKLTEKYIETKGYYTVHLKFIYIKTIARNNVVKCY